MLTWQLCQRLGRGQHEGGVSIGRGMVIRHVVQQILCMVQCRRLYDASVFGTLKTLQRCTHSTQAVSCRNVHTVLCCMHGSTGSLPRIL